MISDHEASWYTFLRQHPLLWIAGNLRRVILCGRPRTSRQGSVVSGRQAAHRSASSVAGTAGYPKELPALLDHGRPPFLLPAIALPVRFHFHCGGGTLEDPLKHIHFTRVIISSLPPLCNGSIKIVGFIAGNLNCQKVAFLHLVIKPRKPLPSWGLQGLWRGLDNRLLLQLHLLFCVISAPLRADLAILCLGGLVFCF